MNQDIQSYNQGLSPEDREIWKSEAREIEWDYKQSLRLRLKNIVKRKGVLERLE